MAVSLGPLVEWWFAAVQKAPPFSRCQRLMTLLAPNIRAYDSNHLFASRFPGLQVLIVLPPAKKIDHGTPMLEREPA